MRPFFETVADAIRTAAAARGTDLRLARCDTREALARHRATRRATASAVRRALVENRAALVESLRAVLAPVARARSPSADIARTRAARVVAAPSDRQTPAAPSAARHRKAAAPVLQAGQAGVWEMWPVPADDSPSDAPHDR